MLDSFGHGSRQLSADAEVPLFNANRDPSKNFNIALALDLTNSMNGSGRLEALKNVTNNFFTGLETRGSDDTMVSLVPYSNYVRLNVADNINQPWIEIPDEIVPLNQVTPLMQKRMKTSKMYLSKLLKLFLSKK